MRNLAALLTLFCLAMPASPLETPEALKSAAFAGLSRAAAAPAIKAGFTRSSYERISGYLNLSGHAFMREGDRFVTVNVDGSALLSGGGGVQSNYARFSERVSAHLSGSSSYVSETVNVSEYVAVYKNGRYVGQAHVTGNIRVSGSVSGNSLRLSGSGSVSGGVFVNEKAEDGGFVDGRVDGRVIRADFVPSGSVQPAK